MAGRSYRGRLRLAEEQFDATDEDREWLRYERPESLRVWVLLAEEDNEILLADLLLWESGLVCLVADAVDSFINFN